MLRALKFLVELIPVCRDIEYFLYPDGRSVDSSSDGEAEDDGRAGSPRSELRSDRKERQRSDDDQRPRDEYTEHVVEVEPPNSRR